MLTKLVNLLAISSLAILACSFSANPVTAVSVSSPDFTRRHDGIALRRRSLYKRQATNRCRAKPPQPSPPAANNGGGNGGGNGNGNGNNNNGGGNNGGNSNNNNNPNSGNGGGNNGGNPSPASGGGKVGLAWALGNDPAINNLKTANVRFIYTWSENCPSRARELGYECIPMLWGGDNARIQRFKDRVKPGYARFVAGFNEPNLGEQANLSPQRAAQIWIENIEPLRHQGYQTISPATTSAPTGINWMRDMLNACNGRCTFDYMALHWYGSDQQALIRYLQQWHDTFHKPIMLTEFACMDFVNYIPKSLGEINKFYEDAFRFINSQDWIVAAMPFGFMHDMVNVNPNNRLLNGDGHPNALGQRIIHNRWY